MANQGSLELLLDPVAEALLGSATPARLGYTWTDGTPRVVPIWFHWNGDQFILGSPEKAPKLKALAADPRVALSIDDNTFPHKVLLVRGRSTIEMLDDVVHSRVGRPARLPDSLPQRPESLARSRAKRPSTPPRRAAGLGWAIPRGTGSRSG